MSRSVSSSRKITPINPLVDPHFLIVEQPSSIPIRFRYECEGRSAGSIPGARSTPDNRTFPTIKIVNWTGSAVVVISCVTDTEPYRPHPNLLVGKDGCKDGISTMTWNVTPENNVFEYQNMGIQCVKKNSVAASLSNREKKNVDPFKTGFNHKGQKIQLNAVRLSFQVFLRKTCPKGGFKNIPLPPVVSEPIYDKKSKNDLVIVDISEPVGSADGGAKMMIFCEKLLKEDIAVRFFERRDGEIVWTALADLKPQNVHRQVAMSFRTPPYRETTSLDRAVKVQIELYRPSDGATSLPTSFVYIPMSFDISKPQSMKRKRPNVQHNQQLHQFLGANPPDTHVLEAINAATTNNFHCNGNQLNIPLSPQPIISPALNQPNHHQPLMHNGAASGIPASNPNGNQIITQHNGLVTGIQMNCQPKRSPVNMGANVNMNNNHHPVLNQANHFDPLMPGSPAILNNSHDSPVHDQIVNNLIDIPGTTGFHCQQAQQQANYGNWNQMQSMNQDIFFDDQSYMMGNANNINGGNNLQQCNTNYINQMQSPQDPYQQFLPDPMQPMQAQQQPIYPTNNNPADQQFYMYQGTNSPNQQILQPLLTPQQQQQLMHSFPAFDVAQINGSQPTKCELPQLTLNSHEFQSTIGQYHAYLPDADANTLKPPIEENEDEDDLENMTDSFSSLSVHK